MSFLLTLRGIFSRESQHYNFVRVRQVFLFHAFFAFIVNFRYILRIIYCHMFDF